MKKQLEEALPEGSDVYFYVRKASSRTKPKGYSISVGDCTARLRNKTKVHVKGCVKEINTKYVFESIMSQLKK
jgi:hypothetical protein